MNRVKSSRAQRYEAWRKTQGPGYPDFPSSAEVNPPGATWEDTPRIVEAWKRYHAATEAWGRWAARQSWRWKLEDFFRRPW